MVKIKNPEVKEWEIETPKDIRANALKDLAIAYKVNFDKLKKRQIQYFNIKFRSKRKEAGMKIPNTALKLNEKKTRLTVYSKYNMGSIKISKDKCLKEIESIDNQCIIKVKNNKWFICIPLKQIRSDHKPGRNWCSLDPGVINFQTIYSEEMMLKIAVRKELFINLQTKLDQFQSLRSKKSISKSHYVRRMRKLYNKMGNLIDDVHYKLIKFLTMNYENIFLPTFESQEIVGKMWGKRNRRTLLSLKHFRFKQRLKERCCLEKHSQVYDCTEEFTSQTCGCCGKLNKKLNERNDRMFICNQCGMKLDRDVNGARNIGIKNLKK